MFSIVEMVVVLVAAALMTTVAIKEDAAKRRAQVMTAEGQNEAVINSALSDWVTNNYATLIGGGPVAVVANPPTLNDLFTQGNLKQPHAPGPFWGGSYVISMSVGPATCTASAGDCHVTYVMYPSKPLTRGGVPDIVGASQIAQAGGNSFGYSKTQNAGTITGLNGAWTANNPLGNVPAAILATNGPTSDGNSVYIRRDGALTWTGDQNVNHVSLHNVHDLDAEGTVSAANVSASEAVTAATMTATGAIRGNSVISTTTLQAGNIAVPRVSCSPNGATASNSDGSGQQLTCQYGVWLPTGGNLLRMSYNPVSDGSNVSKPTCPAGGTPIIELAPYGWYVDTTATVNYNAYDYGSYWNIRITDGAGGGITANAVAGTYCSY
ncbi:hypothetical protein [Paraburkholderia youngii]|uniref:hypothetical protein n=1 Tax=Paraburkholderia youngii TaxID=2782701 RepID=UPI0015900BF4|nr:hypothetical protein [Paraburkholderia youngii]NUX57928.1 hypothetical protein [Paraburkholderia youngii]